jgi:carbon storage regulator
MLVISRKTDQSIVIADDIVITVLEISGERVKLGITAPASVGILRQELLDEVRRENAEAAKLPPTGLEAVLAALSRGLGPA